jgi:hypothetical protein
VIVVLKNEEVADGPEFMACRIGAADLFQWVDGLAHSESMMGSVSR